MPAPVLVAFDRRMVEGATYRVEWDGHVLDQFEAAESRLCTVTLLSDHPFAMHTVDPELVAAPTPVEVGVAAEGSDTWHRARWEDVVAIEPGSYVVRHGKALVALVLGPWED